MNNGKNTKADQPVAYDVDGNPLYSHPQENHETVEPTKTQVVHMTRPAEPEKPIISEVTKLKHERSKQMFPDLNLSEGEYVISAVRRHIIGMVMPMALGVFLIALSLLALFNYDVIVQSIESGGINIKTYVVILPVILFTLFISLITYIEYYVYTNNRFFLTNESVIQEIQTSLFNKHEQTVSLANIEDASFVQDSILDHIFNYGSIRLSTEGDETTYSFSYVANPKQHIARLNNAVEAFKNGRPVAED